MKKLLTSLPSTKADQFFKSQISQNGILTNRTTTYQHQLQILINSMTKICTKRLSFLYRDLEPLFSENEIVLKDLLRVNCVEQLWDLFKSKDEEINEQGQINLLITLLQELNQRKMNEGDLGNVQKADQYRKVVQWYIPKIVEYQKHFMDKYQQQQMSNWQSSRKQKLQDFIKYETKTMRSFDKMDNNRQGNLINRFRMQHMLRQKQFKDRMEKQIYKINPSKLLQQSKEKALYTKLGTYRLNKQNPYQNQSLTKELYQAAEHEQQRKMMLIDHLKRKQKQKLNRQQQKLNISQQMHADCQRDKVLTNLTFERQNLNQSQNRIKENMRHSINLAKNRKVKDLKKTLEAYVKHEDEAKINQILTTHQQKIRHSNNIMDVVATQGATKEINSKGRYTTIDSYSIDKQLGKQKRQFQRKLKDLFHQEEDRDMTSPRPMYSGRKSLVDLYDKQMKLI